MQLINHTKPKLLIADEGKRIRRINDIYSKEHIDESGNVIPEHTPSYATVIFVADNFTEEDMKLYVEE